MSAVIKPKSEMQPVIEIAQGLYAALARAQTEMQNPGFDSTNPHFKSRFASLASVRNAVVPCFAKHGISLCQDLQTVDSGIACTTILTHASGEQMRFGPLVLPASKADAQGFGSCATYARRYAMMAVAGVVGDDDDDGNAGSVKTQPKAARVEIHQDVWVALKDAANQGEKALRDAWRQVPESTRDAIMTQDNAKWETLKSLAVASNRKKEETV